jgi:hypothetical protein
MYDSTAVDVGLRRLSARMVTNELREILGDDPAQLEAFLDSDLARCALRAAGMEHLATLEASELARRVMSHAPAALNRRRKCSNCAWMEIEEGEARCGKDMWRRRGFSSALAFSTVRRRTRIELPPCKFFEFLERKRDG